MRFLRTKEKSVRLSFRGTKTMIDLMKKGGSFEVNTKIKEELRKINFDKNKLNDVIFENNDVIVREKNNVTFLIWEDNLKDLEILLEKSRLKSVGVLILFLIESKINPVKS